MRVRDSLEPLLASDAVDHGSLKDVRDLWEHIGQMRLPSRPRTPTGSSRRTGDCTGASPRSLRTRPPRSIYLNLMAIIDDHTLDVLPVADTPLESFIAERLRHIDIVEAIEARDRDRTAELMRVHAGG